MRLKYLDLFAAGRAAFLVAYLPFVGTGVLPLHAAAVFAIPFMLAFLAVFWFFWRGRNWARLLTAAYSLLSISSLRYVPAASAPQAVIITADALFSAALFYWLFRPDVRAYFGPRSD